MKTGIRSRVVLPVLSVACTIPSLLIAQAQERAFYAKWESLGVTWATPDPYSIAIRVLLAINAPAFLIGGPLEYFLRLFLNHDLASLVAAAVAVALLWHLVGRWLDRNLHVNEGVRPIPIGLAKVLLILSALFLLIFGAKSFVRAGHYQWAFDGLTAWSAFAVLVSAVETARARRQRADILPDA